MRHSNMQPVRRTLLGLGCLKDRCQALAHALSTSSAKRTASPEPMLVTATAGGTDSMFMQRYLHMVQSDVLRADAAQMHVVQRLCCLFNELSEYSCSSRQHQALTATYQAHRQQRLDQLAAQDAAAQAEQPQPATKSGESAGIWSWLRLKGGGASVAEPASGSNNQLNIQQQQKLAASRREALVLQELGPAPTPPSAPRGVYVWGSVGSGKSLLMDLFYEMAAKHAGLEHSRRMHFNAAMLEVHSRLHDIDQQRLQRQQLTEQSEAAANGLSHRNMPHGVAAVESTAEARSDAETDDEAGAPPLGPLAGLSFLRYWDPEVRKQRDAKAAVLAIRRHLMQTRLGRVKPATLAKANAASLQLVAHSFIRGIADAPERGALGSQHSASLLCFDELQVTDVFSAVALKGVFEALAAAGCVVVITSNRQPSELPRHGLHEVMWQHFIDTLYKQCDVVELSAREDYRRLLFAGLTLQQPVAAATSLAPSMLSQGAGTFRGVPAHTYLHPLGAQTKARMSQLWADCTGQPTSSMTDPSAASATTIQVMFGRTLAVPHSSNGVACFMFEELCGRPLGPADYIAVASTFHTVFLTGVPAMSMHVRDKARRFISLVDELYNGRVLLVMSAAVQPDALFCAEHQEPILDLEQLQFESAVEGGMLRRDATSAGGVAPIGATAGGTRMLADVLGGMEEKFAFKRAVSRLHEMQSEQYKATVVRVRGTA